MYPHYLNGLKMNVRPRLVDNNETLINELIPWQLDKIVRSYDKEHLWDSKLVNSIIRNW